MITGRADSLQRLLSQSFGRCYISGKFLVFRVFREFSGAVWTALLDRTAGPNCDTNVLSPSGECLHDFAGGSASPMRLSYVEGGQWRVLGKFLDFPGLFREPIGKFFLS